MCGIIAVLRRPSERVPPAPTEMLALLDASAHALAGATVGLGVDEVTAAIRGAAEQAEQADRLLRGTPGVRCLLGDRRALESADRLLAGMEAEVAALELHLDAGLDQPASSRQVETVNAGLVRLKDAVWAVHRDRLRAARSVEALGGRDLTPAGVEAFMSIHQALSAIDRLEVRGRDSAGLHVLVRDHGLDLAAPSVRALVEARTGDPLFGSASVRTPAGHLGFVYKAAAEIGDLGDNTAALRQAITDDALLHLAVRADGARAAVLGHTRWASVGIISQANAHPLNSEEEESTDEPAAYVTAVLNGDVDNFADLKASEGLRIAPEITTDAKVIPTLVSRHLGAGNPTRPEGAAKDVAEAFRRTVSVLEGSVAVGAVAAGSPDQLLLALRGSGQALYVGLADDAYVVASEPYGLVEETSSYVRMDGETPANPDNPSATRGQVVVLDAAGAGSLDGIHRFAYDGTPLPVSADDVHSAHITTRDIDRGDYPHFLLKEISESPASFRKTLRGRLVDGPDGLAVTLGADTLPDDLRARLGDGRIRRVLVIGQGTAAVAGQSLAAALVAALGDSPVVVEALPATELSGFGMRADMSDTLVVAISQSGTTTDTNRTVDLVRAAGAAVVAIVNRRNSDLTDKADGVLYTSDGRDVEMSVASTKAFYAQVAAGFLLAFAVADAVGAPLGDDRQLLLASLRDLPDAMERTLALRGQLADAALRLAPSRRHWAVVGNGANRIAAQELRIKLSELCYKAVACDATEDKKHIDLSSEPLILVCAAGLVGSNADDVAKEVAIYRAHKAAPIVIATEGEERFSAALEAVLVPAVHPRLAFVLSTVAGHLFSYEAALVIDAQARPFREARAAIEAGISAAGSEGDAERLLRVLAASLTPVASRFSDSLRANDYDGHLEASTAVRVSSLFRYALGVTPLEHYQAEHGTVGTPSVVVEDLTAALTRAIEELTRPVDAIKHQAKTVTVGISRSDETLLRVPLVHEVLTAGAPRDRLSYRSLRTLANLDPAVAEVTGYTRYRIEGRLGEGRATIGVVDRGGIARDLPSRTERNPVLRGTKRRVAAEGEVMVARGRSDGRTVIHVPETKDGEATGLTLLHVRFHDRLSAASARGVLQGYRGRYGALGDAVTETEPTFRDDLLADVDVIDLLDEPIALLADRWRS